MSEQMEGLNIQAEAIQPLENRRLLPESEFRRTFGDSCQNIIDVLKTDPADIQLQPVLFRSAWRNDEEYKNLPEGINADALATASRNFCGASEALSRKAQGEEGADFKPSETTKGAYDWEYIIQEGDKKDEVKRGTTKVGDFILAHRILEKEGEDTMQAQAKTTLEYFRESTDVVFKGERFSYKEFETKLIEGAIKLANVENITEFNSLPFAQQWASLAQTEASFNPEYILIYAETPETSAEGLEDLEIMTGKEKSDWQQAFPLKEGTVIISRDGEEVEVNSKEEFDSSFNQLRRGEITAEEFEKRLEELGEKELTPDEFTEQTKALRKLYETFTKEPAGDISIEDLQSAILSYLQVLEENRGTLSGIWKFIKEKKPGVPSDEKMILLYFILMAVNGLTGAMKDVVGGEAKA